MTVERKRIGLVWWAPRFRAGGDLVDSKCGAGGLERVRAARPVSQPRGVEIVDYIADGRASWRGNNDSSAPEQQSGGGQRGDGNDSNSETVTDNASLCEDPCSMDTGYRSYEYCLEHVGAYPPPVSPDYRLQYAATSTTLISKHRSQWPHRDRT